MDNPEFKYSADHRPSLNETIQLYESVGWSAYTDHPEVLEKAIANSSSIYVARHNGALFGLCRVLSDDASILYVQDILVHPSHQRRGVGRELLGRVLHRYNHGRQKVLLSDDRPAQLAFYTALGFTRIDQREGPRLRAYVQFTAT